MHLQLQLHQHLRLHLHLPVPQLHRERQLAVRQRQQLQAVRAAAHPPCPRARSPPAASSSTGAASRSTQPLLHAGWPSRTASSPSWSPRSACPVGTLPLQLLGCGSLHALMRCLGQASRRYFQCSSCATPMRRTSPCRPLLLPWQVVQALLVAQEALLLIHPQEPRRQVQPAVAQSMAARLSLFRLKFSRPRDAAPTPAVLLLLLLLLQEELAQMEAEPPSRLPHRQRLILTPVLQEQKQHQLKLKVTATATGTATLEATLVVRQQQRQALLVRDLLLLLQAQ